MVMPLVACAVGHAPHRMHHVSHPSPVPWSCTLLPTHFVARALCCPRPSSPAPFVACALHHPHPSSPALCVTPLVAHVVCHAHCLCHGRAPRHAHRVSRPLSHAPCVVPVA